MPLVGFCFFFSLSALNPEIEAATLVVISFSSIWGCHLLVSLIAIRFVKIIIIIMITIIAMVIITKITIIILIKII